MLTLLTAVLIALVCLMMIARHLRARRRVERMQSRLIRALHIPAGKAVGSIFRRSAAALPGEGLAVAGRRG